MTTRQLDTMKTPSHLNMFDMSAAYAQRFLLQHGDNIAPAARELLNSRELLATTVPDMPGCVQFSTRGAVCVLRKLDGSLVY